MKDAHSISTRRAYGVQRVCRVWHRARSSVYARRQATTSRAPCRRRGPVGAAPDDVLAGHIRRLLEASPFHGEGYRKAWAKLRVAGIRTSLERVRRLMREHDLQAPHRVGHAHGPKARGAVGFVEPAPKASHQNSPRSAICEVTNCLLCACSLRMNAESDAPKTSSRLCVFPAAHESKATASVRPA